MRLYPPGTRKNNRFWIARGRILGIEFEVSSGESDERRARRFARDFERAARERILRERAQPRPPAALTFREAAAIYAETIRLEGRDARWLDRVSAARFRLDPGDAEIVFGALPVADVRPMHIPAVANALYPGRTNATKNRQAFTPAAAVLHFAAENGMRDYLRVRKLKEPPPRSRRPAAHILPLLIANADDPDLRIFLTIIHCQGWRAGETLALDWDRHIRLAESEFELYVRKADTWKRLPMAGPVLEILAAVPPDRRRGKLFRWATYQSMDFHLKKLCRRLGVEFTPHQARHGFASDLNERDATRADIKNASTWTSEKSIDRYIGTDMDHARAVLRRLDRKG